MMDQAVPNVLNQGRTSVRHKNIALRTAQGGLLALAGEGKVWNNIDLYLIIGNEHPSYS